MTTVGVVRQWDNEAGRGVIDSPDTPGGCWAHFSDVAAVGYKCLVPGQAVNFEWEAADQDGFSYRAMRAWPFGDAPETDPVDDASAPVAYRSSLSITFDD